MGRTKKRDNRPRVKPVERIRLSEDHLVRKVVVCGICLVIGVIALCMAVKGWLSTDSGWITVEVNSSSEVNCSGDFTFSYLLGETELSPTAEYKQLRTLYTDATVKAYQLFSAGESFEGVSNVWYLNHHPNEEIVVDEALYRAFSLIQEYGDRSVYLGPVYSMYHDMFFCEDDSQILEYDPYQNGEAAAYYREIAGYAQNPDCIDLELLGDNRVRLYVSPEYLQTAGEYGFTDYLDFFWMKNAFIADYLAGVLTENGFTNGYLSSFDGFFRNLDQSGATYSFNLYDRVDGALRIAGRAVNLNVASRVFLRNYPINSQDQQNYYQLENGEIRYPYVDATDGLCKSGAPGMVSYSESGGCAQVLLSMIPVYIRDTLDAGAVNAMAEQGIDSIYVLDGVIWHSARDLAVEDVYTGYTLAWTGSD